MKKFCLDLKKHATKIINYDKGKRQRKLPLTKEKEKIHCKQKKKLYMQKKI